jgi:hypothetical protein
LEKHNNLLDFVPITWNKVTFWTIASKVNPNQFLKIETYLTNQQLYYQLIVEDPFDPPALKHQSGWRLIAKHYNENLPACVISNHSILKSANFSELFCVMAVMAREENFPTEFEINNTIAPELKRLQKKWKRWEKTLPEDIKNKEGN